MRLVAVAEDFGSSALLDATESQLPEIPAFVTDVLWAGEAPRATRTWDNRIKAWKAVHNIDIRGGFLGYPALMGWVECRNALAHGLGRLTDQQRRRLTEVRKHLDAAGVRIAVDRVLVSPLDIERAALVVRNWIEWLDYQAQRA